MLIIAELLLIAAFAANGIPPGQKGYEGHPGNQGGNTSSFSTGYEGQPGNQGNGTGGYEGQPGNQSNGGSNGCHNTGYEGQPGNQSNGC